jgi:ribosome-associated protein
MTPTEGGRQALVTATPRAVELVETAALAAADKLADGIIAYDVSEQLVITDAFVLCSASNDRQVRAIVDEIELRMRQAGAELIRREGEREGRWVLLDYLDVVVHVQHSEERTYYALERIWKDCPQIPLPELVGVGRGRPSSSPGGTPPPGPPWQTHSPNPGRTR